MNKIYLYILKIINFFTVLITSFSIMLTVNRIGKGSSFIFSLIFTLALICVIIFLYKIIKRIEDRNKSNEEDTYEESEEAMILDLLDNKIENVNIFIKIKDFTIIVLLGLGVLVAGLLSLSGLYKLIFDDKTATNIIIALINIFTWGFICWWIHVYFVYYKIKFRTNYSMSYEEKILWKKNLSMMTSDELLKNCGINGDLSINSKGCLTKREMFSENKEADEFEKKFCEWFENHTQAKLISIKENNSYSWTITGIYDKNKIKTFGYITIIADKKNTTKHIDSKWIMQIKGALDLVIFLDKEFIIKKTGKIRKKRFHYSVHYKAEQLKKESELNIL